MAKKLIATTAVADYIDQISEPRQGEIKKLHALIRKAAPKLKPTIQYGMIGYGTYVYKYANGREGDAPVIALASQKNYISVYVSGAEKSRALLPKASIGKSCIRFRKLEDIDLAMLGKIVQGSANKRHGPAQ